MSEKAQEEVKGDWEDEGGSPAPEPTEKTPKGSETPAPTPKKIVNASQKIVGRVKKKP